MSFPKSIEVVLAGAARVAGCPGARLPAGSWLAGGGAGATISPRLPAILPRRAPASPGPTGCVLRLATCAGAPSPTTRGAVPRALPALSAARRLVVPVPCPAAPSPGDPSSLRQEPRPPAHHRPVALPHSAPSAPGPGAVTGLRADLSRGQVLPPTFPVSSSTPG